MLHGHYKRVKERHGSKGHKKGGVMQEDIIKGRYDARGRYKGEG